MDIFEELANKIKARKTRLVSALKDYFKRLLFPVYLFPIKLATYSLYYLIVFVIKLVIAVLSLVFGSIIYPFKSLKNFLKSILIAVAVLYMFASLFVITDYLNKQYGGWWGKFYCSIGMRDAIQDSVVRIVGGYSEGSGFFIAPNQVITSFHVIADEPSPKIIFPDGTFVTPTKILGDKEADLALLFTENRYEDYVFPLPNRFWVYPDEPLLATGYPLGTDLSGKATILKGNFIDFRKSKRAPIYIQTDISLVEGMSGGPLTDQCGQVVGINTLSLAGLSLFITGDQVKVLIPGFTDQEITKIQVDPSLSPEEAVKAFYTYLKARRMEDGFALLSQEYLQKTNFEEWTNRFKDILDVDVIKSEKFEDTKDTAFVKFSTKNWNDGEVDYHYYEGTWQTVQEDGVYNADGVASFAYKMLKSKIKEVVDPSSEWFYE